MSMCTINFFYNFKTSKCRVAVNEIMNSVGRITNAHQKNKYVLWSEFLFFVSKS